MFYLEFDNNGYLASIYTSPYPQPGILSIESLDGYNFSNNSLKAYYWDEDKLVLDTERLAEIEKEEQQSKKQYDQIARKDSARIEITDAVLTATINTIEVGTQVSGTVSKIYVDYNSVVKKGQLLAELDPSLFQANVDQSEAKLRNANASYSKAQSVLTYKQNNYQRCRII